LLGAVIVGVSCILCYTMKDINIFVLMTYCHTLDYTWFFGVSLLSGLFGLGKASN